MSEGLDDLIPRQRFDSEEDHQRAQALLSQRPSWITYTYSLVGLQLPSNCIVCGKPSPDFKMGLTIDQTSSQHVQSMMKDTTNIRITRLPICGPHLRRQRLRQAIDLIGWIVSISTAILAGFLTFYLGVNHIRIFWLVVLILLVLFIVWLTLFIIHLNYVIPRGGSPALLIIYAGTFSFVEFHNAEVRKMVVDANAYRMAPNELRLAYAPYEISLLSHKMKIQAAQSDSTISNTEEALVIRLAEIYYSHPKGFTLADKEGKSVTEIRHIGTVLNDMGGMEMMRRVHKSFSHWCLVAGAPRNLEFWWDHIGEWLG